MSLPQDTPDVVEIKRGVLEIRNFALKGQFESLISQIPHTPSNELVYFSPNNTDLAIRSAQEAGLNVLTLKAEIQALPPYTSQTAQAGYFSDFKIPADLTVNPGQFVWRRYSFSSRRMLPANPVRKGDEWALFLREGQPAMALDSGRFRGYYVPGGDKLSRCNNPQDILEICHWQSLPAQVYYKESHPPYIVLYKTSMWLPPKHYDLLYKRLIGDTGKSNDGIVLIHRADLPLIKQILNSLGIGLVEGVPPEEKNQEALAIVETAAHITQLAYSSYLKREQGVKELETIGEYRAWEQIEVPEFRDHLSNLSNRAYNFEPMAEELLAYLIDRLPRSFDWKQLRDSGSENWLIQGIILDTDISPEMAGYYKVVVQELGLVMGLMTTRNLHSSGRRSDKAGYFLASNWRVTPYAGRLKLTGTNASLEVDRITGKQAAEEGYSYIYGIPTIESRLAHELYLSAFFLDRDAKYWRGHNEFSRYFAGHGKLIEKMVADFDEPAALFQDVFGNYFYLKFGETTYLEHEKFIRATEAGSWKRFVAHSGLRSLVKSEAGLSAFDLARGFIPKDAGYREVVEAAILGLLRYFGSLPEPEIKKIFSESLLQRERLEVVLKDLIRRSRIVKSGEILYYGYSFCSATERESLADPEKFDRASSNTQLFYSRIRPFLPMMHPLGYGTPLAHDVASGDERTNRNERLTRAMKYAKIVTRENFQSLKKQVVAEVREYGTAVFRAHPWNMGYARAILEEAYKHLSLYGLEVQRQDIAHLYNGNEVNETWLRLYSPNIISRLLLAEKIRRSGFASRVRLRKRK